MIELTEHELFSSSPTAVIFPTNFLYIYRLDTFVHLDPKFILSYWIMVCCVHGVLNITTNNEGELTDVRDKVCQLIKNKFEGNLGVIIVTDWVKLLGLFLDTQLFHIK
jgi:hypothetical protein